MHAGARPNTHVSGILLGTWAFQLQNSMKAGRYELVREIGRGGMGVVHLARDTHLGREVALKMLAAEVMHDPQLRRRLAIEARAASSLSHPGVAAVFDYVEHENDCFIVFEYVEGVTLREWLRNRRPQLEEVLDIAVQLAEALCAAHTRGIIHRDLKPENIMLTPGPRGTHRVKILDFGLAKLQRPLAPAEDSAQTVSVLTQPGFRVGTISYMAPEQLEGEPASAQADVHALGLALYEMVCGRHPFARPTGESTIANILKAEAPSLVESSPLVPAELDRIVHKCLRKRPEERYATAADLLVDLSTLGRDIIAPRGHVASTSTPAPNEKRGSMVFARHPARLVLAAVQIGYLAMYVSVLFDMEATAREAAYVLSGGVGGQAAPSWTLGVIALALVGILVRLYLFSAVSSDFPDLGMKYGRLFPAVLVLDLIWAASPLLLARRMGIGLALGSVAALAYLPFVQRRLVYDAYSPLGGRTSTLKPPTFD